MSLNIARVYHGSLSLASDHRCGRVDDVIVLKSAEKIVPIQQEALITSNPMVKGAVMFGRGRDEAGVLIQPAPEHAFDPHDEAALIAFRNKLWCDHPHSHCNIAVSSCELGQLLTKQIVLLLPSLGYSRK